MYSELLITDCTHELDRCVSVILCITVLIEEHRRMRSSIPLATAALLSLGACSTEGRVTPLTSAGAVPVLAAGTWSLNVRGCERSADCEDLRSAVAGRLVGANLAERIVAAGQPAQLGLTVDVSRVRTVSGAERVFFGALAGRNEVIATATLQDLRGTTQSALRSFKVESVSAAHPFSGESGIQDAYRQFSSDLVLGLRG
jgi:hypothetical protein